MNASDLAKMTVKALNVKARELGMKRYSKLRKAELVAAIVEFTATSEVAVAEVVEYVAPMTNNAHPIRITTGETIRGWHTIALDMQPQYAVKAAESVATAPEEPTEDETTVEELVTAYGLMKATWNRSRGESAKRLLIKLLAIRTQVKAMGHNPVELRMGYSVA